MSFKATYEITQVADVETTLSITMPIKEWNRLIEQIGEVGPNYPLKPILSAVETMMRAAYQQFRLQGETNRHGSKVD